MIEIIGFKHSVLICGKCTKMLKIAVNFRNCCRLSEQLFRTLAYEDEERIWNKKLVALQSDLENTEAPNIDAKEIEFKTEPIESHFVEFPPSAFEESNNCEWFPIEIDKADDTLQIPTNEVFETLEDAGTFECDVSEMYIPLIQY